MEEMVAALALDLWGHAAHLHELLLCCLASTEARPNDPNEENNDHLAYRLSNASSLLFLLQWSPKAAGPVQHRKPLLQGRMTQVLSSMRVLMTEDSNDHADSSSFLLDDNFSIPFSIDDISSSIKDWYFLDVKPADELLENPAFECSEK